MTILILGHNGLLGKDLNTYNEVFKKYNFLQVNNSLRWPSIEFKNEIRKTKCDVIINCVSIGNFDNIEEVNSVYYELPLFLSLLEEVLIINFTSDILNSKQRLSPISQNYFFVKKKAETIVNPGVFLNVRTSFIGLSEKKSNFLHKNFHQSDLLLGYSNLKWSGVTSLEIFKCIDSFIECIDKKISKINLSSNCISNFDLMVLINSVFGFKRRIQRRESFFPDSRCSNSDIVCSNIKTQLEELYQFKENHCI